MKEFTSITWSEAIQKTKENKVEQEKHTKEYEKLLDGAYKWFMDNIETDNRSLLHFQDACEMYGVEQDDLILRII